MVFASLLATVLSLNGAWEFRFEEGKAIEQVAAADFVATETMTVPGCYDALPAYRYRRGTGLYRRAFTLERPVTNAWLVIDGMGLRGSFAIDGRSLGVHPYPYARLELATGPLAAGEHTLFAALDNRLDWKTMKLARTFYDFYLFGGFYRSVALEFDDRRLLVRTRDYRTGEIEVRVVRRDGGIDGDAGFDGEHTLVFDGTNAVKAVFTDGKAVVKVPDFKLWSPDSPNLHTVALQTSDRRVRGGSEERGARSEEGRGEREIRDEKAESGGEIRKQIADSSEGRVVGLRDPRDRNLPNLQTSQTSQTSQTCRFGIRTIEARERRLFLNGKPVFLKGVNRHEQSRGHGVVMTGEERLRDLKLLKKLGANFIRGAHYQQDPKFLDLCDEMGFLVWEESLGWGNGQDYTKEGSVEELKDGEFIAQQLAETRGMVRTSFNHPSVIIYAFLNECGSHRAECKTLVDALVSEIRSADSGRLVTFACNIWDRDICNENTDLVAFNAYPGTIPARPGTKEELRKNVFDSFGRIVKAFRRRYPDKPIMVSESGCGGFYGVRDETAPFGTEDFQNEYLTDIMDAIWTNDDIVGYSIWQFADSTTHQRNCGSKSGRIFGFSTAGIYDFERRPKLSVDTVKRYFASRNLPEITAAELSRSREWFLENVYGKRPPAADSVKTRFTPLDSDRVMMNGTAVRKRVKVTTVGPFGTNSFAVTAFVPAKAERPVPAFLLICNRNPEANIDPERLRRSEFWPAEEIVRRGYAAVTFYNGEVAPDDAKSGCREGVFACFDDPSVPRAANGWGTLSAWAWGASRVMDWLETLPEIDARHVAVVGHSRGGKTALLTGVTDARFALSCSNDSGCSGAKLNRMTLPESEPIGRIVEVFPHWFAPNYAKWSGRDSEVPYDQDLFVAQIAPRLVAIGSAIDDAWAGPAGEAQCAESARRAWQNPSRVDYHIRPGGHGLKLVDWTAYLDFADRNGFR